MPARSHRLVQRVLLAAVVCAVARGADVVVERADKFSSGSLVSIDRADVVLSTDSGEQQRIASRDVLSIEFADTRPLLLASAAIGEVGLIGGARFEYDAYEVDGDQLRFSLPCGAEVTASIEGLTTWMLQPASDRFGAGRVADVLLVKRPDGELTPVEGVLVGVSPEGLRFSLDPDDLSDPVSAPWTRIAGMRLYRGDLKNQSWPAAIQLTDGSRHVADEVTLRDGRLRWTHPHGGGQADIDAIESIDLSAGRVTPVSRLEPLEQAWRPFFPDTPRLDADGIEVDRSFSGEPLSLRFPNEHAPQAWPEVARQHEFANGLAVRSEGVVRFELPADAVRVRGWIGLDPATARSGSAEVRLATESRTLWSGVVDGSTRPVEIDEPIDGDRDLSLHVGFGDNLDTGDNVHFANLRVIQ